MRKVKPSSVLLLAVFLVGLSLLLYPTVSNWWNSMHQSQAIAEYAEEAESLDTEQIDQLWSAAETYNQGLVADADRFSPSDEERAAYEQQLSVSDTGVMGSVEIPRIGVSLPIYHGTGEAELAQGAGHMEGSSLPVGGQGTHCVLSGHRGLPSARLFTDLDELEEGDVFMLHVLGRTLTYQVDRVLVTNPYDMSGLDIDPNEDYCTLLTCTPYGINTERLLVRGHRIANLPEQGDMPSAGMNPVVLGSAAAALAIAALAVGVGIKTRLKARR